MKYEYLIALGIITVLVAAWMTYDLRDRKDWEPMNNDEDQSHNYFI